MTNLYKITYRTPPGTGITGKQERYIIAENPIDALNALKDEVETFTFIAGERASDEPPLRADG